MSTPDPRPGPTSGLRRGSVEGVRPAYIPPTQAPTQAGGTAGVPQRESPVWQAGSKALLVVIAALGGLITLVFAALAVVWLSRI